MLNILLVEDNEDHMKWLVGIINKRKHAIDCDIAFQTQNWNEALEILKSRPEDFDIVVSDLQDAETMEFLGLKVIKLAKSLNKPVIAISSFLDDEAHMRDVLRSGADFYVKKPFKPKWRDWEEYNEELYRSADLSLYFALRRFCETCPDASVKSNDVFLSYSIKDQEVADELYEMLKQKGISCFMGSRDIEARTFWEDDSRRAIESSLVVLVLITQNSKKSAWVLAEAGAAWGLKKTIIPIIMAVSFDELPELITKSQVARYDTMAEREKLVERVKSVVDSES